MGLGAFQAGAYHHLREQGSEPSWIAGSSVGAVNAALIAGAKPEKRVETLRVFWEEGRFWTAPGSVFLPRGTMRHASNWVSAIQSRLTGSAGFFHPRWPGSPLSPFKSLYDLSPMKDRLERLVDFELLNTSDIRVSVATTDIETGEQVVFDTGRGHKLSIEHIMASCGLLPEFAPIELDGRLLGDGGLSANAPVGIILQEPAEQPRVVFVLDLFSRDGARPTSLTESIARKNDLMFANHTLDAVRCYFAGLKAAGFNGRSDTVCYLSYRAAADEAGPEKLFDLSEATVKMRWLTGALDMQEAIARLNTESEKPLILVRR
jgi:NTE family protein